MKGLGVGLVANGISQIEGNSTGFGDALRRALSEWSARYHLPYLKEKIWGSFYDDFEYRLGHNPSARSVYVHWTKLQGRQGFTLTTPWGIEAAINSLRLKDLETWQELASLFMKEKKLVGS